MLRIHLTDSPRSDLRALRRADPPAAARDRREMVVLSAAGWSPPRIAEHPGRHPHTVRAALKGFAARGAKASHPAAPGPDPDHARREQVTARLRGLPAQDRAWTSRQLADALGPAIGIGHRQTRRHLARLGAGYRRTARTAAHEPDRPKVGRAGRVLASLGNKPRPGGRGCSTRTRPGSARRSRPGTRGPCRGNASGPGTSTRRAAGWTPWPPTNRAPPPWTPSRSSGRSPATTGSLTCGSGCRRRPCLRR